MNRATYVAAALIAIGATPALSQTFEMKVGFVTVNDSQHQTAKWFAEEMQARTNGAIKVKIFPLAQLGKIPRQVEGIQLGTQEAFISPPGFFVGINPAEELIPVRYVPLVAERHDRDTGPRRL